MVYELMSVSVCSLRQNSGVDSSWFWAAVQYRSFTDGSKINRSNSNWNIFHLPAT